MFKVKFNNNNAIYTYINKYIFAVNVESFSQKLRLINKNMFQKHIHKKYLKTALL